MEVTQEESGSCPPDAKVLFTWIPSCRPLAYKQAARDGGQEIMWSGVYDMHNIKLVTFTNTYLEIYY